MRVNNQLYNVNEIMVKPGLEADYIKFSSKLNRFLMRQYPLYYVGLQLYQNNNISNLFHVVAAYNDVPGLYEIIGTISEEISMIYEETWGDDVTRKSVFTFADCTVVVPKSQ